MPVGWAPILERIPRDVVQDIDVLFYGVPGQRRLALYSQLCKTGASAVFACGLYGTARDSLIARAKVVLNIDLNDSRRIFEVVRVSYLLANAKAVVATLQPHTLIEPDLRDAVAFAPAESIAATCVELLANEPARRQLEAAGRAGDPRARHSWNPEPRARLGSLCISIRGCDGGVSGWMPQLPNEAKPKRMVDPLRKARAQ